MDENIGFNESNVYIENRRKIKLTGVNDVDSFDDFNVSAKTSDGNVVVSGENLKISKLDVDSGELIIEGKLNSMFYNEEQKGNSSSFFGKIFK